MAPERDIAFISVWIVDHSPSWLRRFFHLLWVQMNYGGRGFNVAQCLLIGIISGTLGGIMAMTYYQMLAGVVNLIWTDLYYALKDRGLFDGSFREYNFIWLGTSIYIVLHIFFLYVFRKYSIGNLELVVERIHTDCKVPREYFIPMLIHSLLCLATGCGVSQESPLVVLGASMSSFFGQIFQLDNRPLRIFVISGIGGVLSGYFGAPITGIFALEILHRVGFEYYEAFPAVIVSSYAGATVMQAMFGNYPYAGFYVFPPGLQEVSSIHFVEGLFFGVVGAVVGSAFIYMTHFYNFVHRKLGLGLWKIPLPVVAWIMFSGAGIMLPQILFWGHPELQSIINLNVNSTAYHYQGGNSGVFELPTPLTPGVVFAIAITKLVILPMMFFLNMKGGIVFALFSIGGVFGRGFSLITGFDTALGVTAVMAAAQSSVTRTPFSSALVCFFNGQNLAPQLLIPIFAASFLANLLTLKVVLVPSQRPRTEPSYVEHSDPEKAKGPAEIAMAPKPEPAQNGGPHDEAGEVSQPEMKEQGYTNEGELVVV